MWKKLGEDTKNDYNQRARKMVLESKKLLENNNNDNYGNQINKNVNTFIAKKKRGKPPINNKNQEKMVNQKTKNESQLMNNNKEDRHY